MIGTKVLSLEKQHVLFQAKNYLDAKDVTLQKLNQSLRNMIYNHLNTLKVKAKLKKQFKNVVKMPTIKLLLMPLILPVALACHIMYGPL